MSDLLLELRIDSRDETIIKEVEANLSSIKVTRWETARMDPVTILAIGAATVKLITALLELKAKLAQKPDAPKVTVKSADGTSIALSDATEAMLNAMLSAVKPGK
jgi:hypothetical protein